MINSPSKSLATRLLAKIGGYYVYIVLLFGQVITGLLGFLVAGQVLRMNAGFSPSKLNQLALAAGLLVILRNLILFIYVFFTNRAVFSQLNKQTIGLQQSRIEAEDYQAWRQITSLPWRYIGISFLSLILIITPLLLAYLFYALNSSIDQVIYTLIAIFVTGLSISLLEVLIIEGLLLRPRYELLPQKFEAQLAGVTGIRLLTKFQIAFFALILVSILLIAPIGYHQTTTVLYEEIGSQRVLLDLQLQSLLVGAFSLLLGLGLSYALTRAISQPIRQMIHAFTEVEQGDLKQRLPISATDEVGELSVYFNRMISRLDQFQSGLEKQVADRTAQLRATNEVGQVASGILRPDELMSRIVNLITDRFGYYYSAIFLIDTTGRWAVLKDATGIAGQTLKAQGHRLEVGGRSMVGTTTSTRQARIALDVGAESVRFDNPLLPETRSEISLPLIIGERVIGALDVQSKQASAFQENDIITLQGMANQVAIALENARLFQETQQSLEELRAAHRLYISESWNQIGRDPAKYEYSTLNDGIEENQGNISISVPLTLREQIIGQLNLESTQEWTPEERALIEAVATQTALALENARLLEQSQQLAIRERLTAEIIGKVWSSPNMDVILQTAIKELCRALQADEATIEVNLGKGTQ
jgi:GAF domain-containing protein/HAMP domain-containing protein